MDSIRWSRLYYSTTQFLRILNEANPKKPLTEARLRHAMRSGRIAYPVRVGVNLAWGIDELIEVCNSFDLEVPENL